MPHFRHIAERERYAAARPSLAGATRRELTLALAGAGVPERAIRMRVAQLWHWIYHAGVTSFDAMGNVSKSCGQGLG
jgi:23S rRNA (adenine2503-C2)-methyltransferase